MEKIPKTHVVMLLDESSSMSPHHKAVISTFNEYVDGLKVKSKRCYLSLFKFDLAGGTTLFTPYGDVNSILREVFENRKVKECHPLKPGQYTPRGLTPLYDAIGTLIERTKERLPKKAKVLFIIHTDGQENASRKYNQESVKQLISKCEKKRGWTFVYLGEGPAAWNAGYDFGVDNVANFSSGLRGESMSKLADATAFYSCDASVGGERGTSKAFYQNAGLDPDDVDPNETLKTTSSVITSSDEKTTSATD